MLTKRALLAGMAATGFGLATTRPTSAQTYPTRPVKMVVPLPPGSAPDVRHRLIAQALTQLWGQQVIVENRPGGGGIIGTRAVLGEQPDGYTLLAALASIYMILPAQHEKLPFDVNKDMIPIGLTAYEGLVMACSPKLGVKSLADFVALAKKMPDKLVIGTNPAGSLPHITAKLFVDLTNTGITVVPYSTGGTADAIRDIMGGRVHAVIDGWASLRGAYRVRRTSLRSRSCRRNRRLCFPTCRWQPRSFPASTRSAGRRSPRVAGRRSRSCVSWTTACARYSTIHSCRSGFRKPAPSSSRLYGDELTRFIQDEQKFWLPLAKKYAT